MHQIPQKILIIFHLVLQLSLPNPFQPVVK